MRLLAIAAAVAAWSTAHAGEPTTIDDAFPPTVRVGSPRNGVALDRVTVEHGSDVTWLTLSLMAHSHIQERVAGCTDVVPIRVETELAIDLPQGARVIGVALGRGGATVWGRAVRADRGQSLFHHAQAPALIEHAGASGDTQHLVLRIAAIANDGPTNVTLGLALPGPGSVAINAGARLVIDGKQVPTSSTLAVRNATPLDVDTLHVDAKTSLLASFEPTVTCGQFDIPTTTTGSLDSQIVRKLVRLHYPRLRRCYMQVAQGHPDLEGPVVLSFFIQPDGGVSHVSVAGGPVAESAVGPCLTDEVASWEFPAWDGGAIQVNYPLDFKLNR